MLVYLLCEGIPSLLRQLRRQLVNAPLHDCGPLLWHRITPSLQSLLIISEPSFDWHMCDTDQHALHEPMHCSGRKRGLTFHPQRLDFIVQALYRISEERTLRLCIQTRRLGRTSSSYVLGLSFEPSSFHHKTHVSGCSSYMWKPNGLMSFPPINI